MVPARSTHAPSLSLGTANESLRALLTSAGSAALAGVPRIGGLLGGSLGYVIAGLAPGADASLAVVSDAHARDDLLLDLETFAPPGGLSFPAWPRDAGGGTPPDAEVLAQRTQVLAALSAARRGTGPSRSPPLIVAGLSALVQPVPAPAVIDAAGLTLTRGESQRLPVLLEHLALCGYARVPAVEAPGEFAARGGVLDVWPLGHGGPVRLDFLGDEIESLRDMDPTTQRSGRERASVDLLVLPPERVRTPDEGPGRSDLAAHLPPGARVLLVAPEALAAEAGRLASAGGLEGRRALSALQASLHERPVLELGAAPLPTDGAASLTLAVEAADAVRGVAALRPDAVERAALEPQEARTRRIAEAFLALGRRARAIVVYRRAPGEEERLTELLRERPPGVPVTFVAGSLTRSFVFGPTATAHVAYDDLTDLPVRERRRSTNRARRRPLTDFLELEPNVPVVHLHHGVGIFRGLTTLPGPDGPGEFLELRFAEGTTVYVPVARIDLVQRYVGTGLRPRLARLSGTGGKDWEAKRQAVERAVEELAEELLDMQAARHRRHVAPCPPDGPWQREFEGAFPHPLTPDQESAARAVRADLEGERPMDRLLCGDVGYGKTEVALRAIFKVVAAGRQAAVLVPTKVLAEQHVRTFAQRLAAYPLRVRALSSLHGGRATRETVEALAAGTVDVVVGTHRLLSKDVRFKNLGLVVVDEEQRFGVKHKERLKSLRAEVDLLTLSATPIPRTLHMALLGLKDISNLTTPPLGRHPVETRVEAESDDAIASALRRELDRGGQAFLVTSRIADLAPVARRLVERIPDIRLAAIHGRMDKDQVESRMLRFVRGDLDLLLATTIIESGLDIPNANTIVIRDADRYGLAELHQLRGRVGREHRQAHALLLLPERRVVNPEALERLKAIEEYSELGAGFRIAMRDLEIRGAGNLLGAQQSGHIAAVGYDLYCRLLADAVRRAKGQGPPPPSPAYLAIDVPAGVPDAWVADAREKFRLLRRLSATETPVDFAALATEFAERFGAAPPEARRLLLAQETRIHAGHAGFLRIQGAEHPGVLLVEAPGSRALDRLAARGVLVRRLGEDRGFVPMPGVQGPEPTLRALLHLLRPAVDSPGEPGTDPVDGPNQPAARRARDGPA